MTDPTPDVLPDTMLPRASAVGSLRSMLITAVVVAATVFAIAHVPWLSSKPALAGWLIFASGVAGSVVVLVIWSRWFSSHRHQPWTVRLVWAGFVFGGAFANLYVPVFGGMFGAFLGPLIGVIASGPLGVLTGMWRRDPPDAARLHRRSQFVSLGMIGAVLLGVLAISWAHFDDPVSKYVSEGEIVRMFLSMAAWPSFLLGLYVVVAGPPSAAHPFIGEGGIPRRRSVQALVVLAILSSIYIGAYWLFDNFPHPD